jgi:hypothetical protein
VYCYFLQWEQAGVTDASLLELRIKDRRQAGCEDEPSGGIIDLRSVKGADTVGCGRPGRLGTAGGLGTRHVAHHARDRAQARRRGFSVISRKVGDGMDVGLADPLPPPAP